MCEGREKGREGGREGRREGGREGCGLCNVKPLYPTAQGFVVATKAPRAGFDIIGIRVSHLGMKCKHASRRVRGVATQLQPCEMAAGGRQGLCWLTGTFCGGRGVSNKETPEVLENLYFIFINVFGGVCVCVWGGSVVADV